MNAGQSKDARAIVPRSRHRFDFVALTHNTPAAGNTALARALSFCTDHAKSVPAARPRGILFLMTIA